jgi:hypothetical protein
MSEIPGQSERALPAFNRRFAPVSTMASNGVVHLPRVTLLDTLRLVAILVSIV